jgi:glycosyltransferase involved in cell wall biosynthesis
VSISQATDKTLLEMEGVSPLKIVKIPHGFDWREFQKVSEESIGTIRKKWNIRTSKHVVGVIARHIEWKGIQYIIPAFRGFLKKYPDASLVLANASGPYHKALMELLVDFTPGQVVIIPFEEDVVSLYGLFDVYVHTPVDPLSEAFGQTYIEALICGVPSVFTLSGIAAEFVKDRSNALVVPFRNSAAILEALCLLAEDEVLGRQLAIHGKRDVLSRFGLENMVALLRKMYDE